MTFKLKVTFNSSAQIVKNEVGSGCTYPEICMGGMISVQNWRVNKICVHNCNEALIAIVDTNFIDPSLYKGSIKIVSTIKGSMKM